MDGGWPSVVLLCLVVVTDKSLMIKTVNFLAILTSPLIHFVDLYVLNLSVSQLLFLRDGNNSFYIIKLLQSLN